MRLTMKQVHEAVLPTVLELKFFNFEPIIFCLFALFAIYVLYQYIQYQIRKLDVYSFLFHRKKGGNTHIYNIESCPICLGEFKVPVRASCGHAFCMKCLLSYFQYNSYCWKCICPLCRGLIRDIYNLHIFDFCKKEKAEIKKMEKKLKTFIEKQNYSIAHLSRLEWICTNKWKSIFSAFSIIICFITILFWPKTSSF
ncbi:hypothetical protein ILUMI_05616 [Ignelater luminosus]|uniref:RING-type domain-containing protein n=1 Tax=Ignelater luminosus TaxID=2038154 RepID=A0A8K0DA60_IGNLU|nr:hypothetical protein ILUMI_05616 [Ignelater luminosus]